METTANETNERFMKHEAELGAISEKATALGQQLVGLSAASNEKLSKWQDDFTEKKTAWTQEYSDAQIECDTKFEELFLEWKANAEAQQTEIAKTQNYKLEGTLDAFKTTGENILADVTEKHESIRADISDLGRRVLHI